MKITVITINYNNAVGLRNTILSVIRQTNADFEYIIIDGGSTDNSKSIIEEYSDNIDYWISEKDNGIYNAMNKGVAHAHGEYCIFMNSGDCFCSENVLNTVFSKKNTQSIITGITIGRDENDVWFNTTEPLSLLTFYRGTISHQSSFIKTSLLKEMPYSEDLKIVADWEFWIKAIILKNCSYTFCNCFVAQIEPNGISIKDEYNRDRERQLVLERLIPNRILDDYVPLKYADDELVKYVSVISKTYRIKKIVKTLLKVICKFTK